MPHKCPEKQREYRREYQERNREKIRDYMREYMRENYKRNRERKLLQNHKYRERNREKLLEYYREKHKRNPQNGGTACALKRSPLTLEELFCGLPRDRVNSEVAFDYRLCRLISEKEGIEHHIDHIVPLSKGGVHRVWNLRILPASENLSKYDKFDDEWFNLTDEEIEAIERETLEFTP